MFDKLVYIANLVNIFYIPMFLLTLLFIYSHEI